MLFRKPRVGGEINSYCGKCKLDRTHIVAAMDGENVKRVTCSTCGSTHNHRAAPVTKTTPTVAKPKTGTRTTRAKREPAGLVIDSGRPLRNYDRNSPFTAGDQINHPTFGPGVVQAINPPNKMEVRFQEGTKVLLQNLRFFSR